MEGTKGPVISATSRDTSRLIVRWPNAMEDGEEVRKDPRRCGRSVPYVFFSTQQESMLTKRCWQENCWFCLSNPQVTKHLIAAIGSETYVTLPKGQLPDVNADCPVPGGGHVLIIPVSPLFAFR